MKSRGSLRRCYFRIKETVNIKKKYYLNAIQMWVFQNSKDKGKNSYDPLEIPKRKFLQYIKNPTCV